MRSLIQRGHVHSGEDGIYGFVGGLGGGIDGEARQAAVERVAAGEALLGGDGVLEDGAADVLQHAAVVEGGEGSVEEDGEGAGGLLDEESVGELFGRAAAECEDGLGAAEGGGEGARFKAAEAGFAVKLEELGNGGAGAGFEVSVDVEEVPADTGGEETADGGLACSHEPGEDEAFEVGGDDGGDDGFGQGAGLTGMGGCHGVS